MIYNEDINNNMGFDIDIDIENIGKIRPLQIAIRNDTLKRGLDSIYLINLILNKYFNIETTDLKVFYKLMLKEAVNKETTLFNVFINILYGYYEKDLGEKLLGECIN